MDSVCHGCWAGSFTAREEFSKLTGLGHWAGGAYDGRIRVPVTDLAKEERPLVRVLRHELVHAVVVIEDGASASEAELIEHTRKALASYKKPEKIYFTDELPRNALGKVIRPRVKEQFGGG